ncbi:MAG: hypothetical protein HKN22_03250, partial [Bacteroidia bacterium]|nr:hypothetical protein [Bacteroidia bacterium]
MKKLFLSLSLALSVLCLNAQDKPQYDIVTYRAGTLLGTIHIELFPLIAPLHVQNFDTLVSQSFYDSTAFHRVIPGFVIQGGDPNSRSGPKSTWGFGQPGQPTVNAEFNAVSHRRGILSAARSSNINSATSQFFICHAAATNLDWQYSAYGRVLTGIEIVDSIVFSPRDGNDCPLQKIEMFVTRTGYQDTIPEAPTGFVPMDGATGVAQSTRFQWDPAFDAILYEYELSTDSGFSTIISQGLSNDTSFVYNVLQPLTTYYWKVRTNNGGYNSTWSATHSFQTGLPGPTLVSPGNGSSGVNIPVTLLWNGLSGADSYHLQVARSSSFSTPSIVLDVDSINDTTYVAANLNPNTNYFWRVRGRTGA